MENLELLLLTQQDQHKRAQLFGALFDQLPTYADLDCATPKTPLFTWVNSVFRLLTAEKSLMVPLFDREWKPIYDSLLILDAKLKQLIINSEAGHDCVKA